MTRRIFPLLLLLAAVAGLWTLALQPTVPTTEPMSAECRELADDRSASPSRGADWATRTDGFIAHGGGGIDGKTYTNSLEAVMQSIRRGYRMIELDLLVTTDGYLVAAHDWKTFRQRTGEPPESAVDRPLSLAEFGSRRIDGRYTPLGEQAIRRMLLQHPDLILVTDKIRDFSRLVAAFPFQERVIVEVFSAREVSLAKTAGVANPMLSIGNLEASLGLVLDQPVRHVALNIDELRRCPAAARKIINSGRRIFAYTSDDARVMARYAGTHVSAFYTDFWHVAQGRCEGMTCLRNGGRTADAS